MHRRRFLQLAAAGSALSALRASSAAAMRRASLERIGLQLYTARTLMQQDAPGTIRLVAEAGFQEVEFAGYFGMSPAETRELLDGTGLTSPSTHATLGALREDVDGWVETCLAIGHEYLVCSWMSADQRTTLDAWRGIAHEFNRFGEKCRDAGVRFAFHNHEFEFAALDGVRPYDLLLERTDPDLVKMELDLYWVAFAGVDAAAMMQADPSRYRLFHLKDMGPDRAMRNVGSGTLDFAGLIATARAVGGEHFYVERDDAPSPLEDARQSLDYLKTL